MRDRWPQIKLYIPSVVLAATFIVLSVLIFASPPTHIHAKTVYLISQVACIYCAYKLYRVQIKKFTLKHNEKLKWFASIYPGVAAVWLIFFKDGIYENTKAFIDLWNSGAIYHEFLIAFGSSDGPSLSKSYTVDVWTVYYVVILFFWLFIYFFFVTNESAKNEERNQKIEATILRSPDPKVFTIYNSKAATLFNYFLALNNPTRESYHAAFQYFLRELCDITRTFMNKTDSKDVYGANIMLYISTRSHRRCVEYLRSKEDSCFHFRYEDISHVAGVLRLVPGLIFSNASTISDGDRTIPAITLPILRARTREDFVRENLTGASLAALKGEYVLNDVDDELNYTHLKQRERDIAKDYWQTKAKEVKGVISIVIPFNSWHPEQQRDRPSPFIGVLNVDSTKPFPLGKVEEFHNTYWSLIRPLLWQISPHLEAYHNLYMPDLEAVAAGATNVVDI